MTEILHILVWEWINIALECTATAWVRLPRFPLAVAGVNLVTHPLLMVLLARFGRAPVLVFPFEAAIVVVEWAMLRAIYRTGCADKGRPHQVFLFAVSFLMNAVSYGTGVMLNEQM